MATLSAAAFDPSTANSFHRLISQEPMAMLHRSSFVDNSSATHLRASRISTSDPSNSSATDLDESISDLDSVHDTTISPSGQSSRTTSPSDPNASSRKNKTSALRLSLKSLRSPRLSFHIPSDNEHSTDHFSVRRSMDGGGGGGASARISQSYRASLDLPLNDQRASFDSMDPRRRDQLLSSQISASTPKASRLSFLHSPTLSTSFGARPHHQRSYTTPTDMSPRGTSPPKPVKETRTMTKEYDPTTGVKMINKYMVVQELGRGVHGKVKLCRDTTTGKLCAIKIVDKTTRKRLGRGQITNAQKIRREIAIMKKCIHPNVVRLIEVIDDPDVRKIYLVLEYMEGGEVRWKDSDGRPILSLEHARSFFRDIVLGLEYLHMQGIIHRDIKPANLLLSGDGTVKISDFGVSHFSEKNVEYHQENTSKSEKDSFFKRHHHQWNSDLELAKTAGSPAFFAPELCYASELSPAMSPMLPSESQSSLGGEPSTPTGMFSVGSSQGYSHRPPITKAIDVWALGVTLYCFIYGRCPFNAETEFELFNMIPRVQPSYESVPGREDVCPELKDLLSRLLEKDVSRRITLKEVKEHPWVVEDLKDPEKWRIETDPSNYQRVFVTDEEVKSAVTIMDKIKKHFRRLSVSITNLAFNRRRSKSFASAYPPESPAGPRSPTSTIMGLPVPTTSQSMDHAMAQPQRFTSPMSLPERFQKFQMFGQPHSGSNSNSGHRHSDRLVRPNSVYSNSSSIEELREEEDQGGFVARRRIPGSNGLLIRPQSYGGRPLSIPSTSSSRSYSDDQVDRVHHGFYSQSMATEGIRPSSAHSNHSALSRSWVNGSGTGLESIVQQQGQAVSQRQSFHREREATLSPSLTLVSDSLGEKIGQVGSHESLAKSPLAPGTSLTSSKQDTHQEL